MLKFLSGYTQFHPGTEGEGTTNVSGIEDNVLSMYSKGMSQRDIVAMIQDIYGKKDILGLWLNQTDSKHS